MPIVSPKTCPTCGTPISRNARSCRPCEYASRNILNRSRAEILADPETVKRFMAKVQKDANERGCWHWIAHLATQTGYGQFGIYDKVESAHRVSYELFRGPIPEGMWILHSCDNRQCVNPDHLSPGPPKANSIDCARKGRISTQKLTDVQIIEIRDRYAQGGISQKEIGALYGIAQSHIQRIVNHETWEFLE